MKVGNVKDAIKAYFKTCGKRDIHMVGLGITDDGEVKWGERGPVMLADYLAHVDVPGKDVLSVGFNTGGDVVALLEAGAAHVTGVEMMPELVAMTSALLVLGMPEADWTLYAADIEDWEPDRQFDLVYIPGVLYHSENPMRALRQCFKALKPGGQIAIETEIIKPLHAVPENTDLIFWPLREFKYIDKGQNWPSFFIFSEEAFLCALRCAGFEDGTKIQAYNSKTAFVARRPE